MSESAAELLAAERPSLEAIAEALRPGFAVHEGEQLTVQRIYLDTFDALLRAAGLNLRWDDGMLVLSAHESGSVRGSAVLDEPAGPFRVGALPAGSLRDVVANVIDVRALLPRARVRVAVRRFAILDELEKTVVRVVVEEPEFLGATGRATALRTRVHLVGVRGYDDELSRVRDLLAGSVAAEPAKLTLEEEAVIAAGGVPEGVGTKLDVPLSAGQRADTAAVAVLARLGEIIEATLPGTIADIDPEFLHDFRVSVRRTRSVLRELRGVFPPEEWERMRQEFRWLQQATGDARDLDVYVIDFESMRGLVPESVRGELQPLLGVLGNRRLVAHAEMVRAIRSQRATTLRREWTALLGQLPRRAYDDRPDAVRPIGEVASERITAVYRRMLKMGLAIGPDSPPEDYHELRKKGKELRYLLELFGVPLHDAEVVKPMIRRLKALQDVLGRHQDREVQVTMLMGLRDEVSGLPGGPGALMAMGMLVEHLESDAHAARTEFAGVFEQFAGKAQQAQVTETFQP